MLNIVLSWLVIGQTPLELCTCKAVTMHHTMPLQDRLQNAMTGYLLVDLWAMLADAECKKRSLPKGSLSMSPQTAHNLQYVSMGIIGVCATLGDRQSPFLQGHNRMTELPVEEWFGALRCQSSSAQLTVRSFWQAAARQMIRQSRSTNPGAEQAQKWFQNEKPGLGRQLSPCEFYEASEKAMNSSMRFVAFCAGTTPTSLAEVYKQWCVDNTVGTLEGDGWGDDDLEESLAEDGDASKILQHIHEDAVCHAGVAADDEEDLGPDPNCKAADLRSVPDLEQNHTVLDAPPDSADKMEPFCAAHEGCLF